MDHNRIGKLFIIVPTTLLFLALAGIIVGYAINMEFNDRGLAVIFLPIAWVLIGLSGLSFFAEIGYLVYFRLVKRTEFPITGVIVGMALTVFAILIAGVFFLMISMDAWSSGW